MLLPTMHPECHFLAQILLQVQLQQWSDEDSMAAWLSGGAQVEEVQQQMEAQRSKLAQQQRQDQEQLEQMIRQVQQQAQQKAGK
jgi:hypothetical protein